MTNRRSDRLKSNGHFRFGGRPRVLEEVFGGVGGLLSSFIIPHEMKRMNDPIRSSAIGIRMISSIILRSI